MKYLKFNLLVISLFTIASINAQVENKSFFHDGADRDYIVYTPTDYDGSVPLPLLFCFHGFTSNANTLMQYSGFNNLAEVDDFIVIYPQGLSFNGSTHWNVGGFTLGSTVDDVDFIDMLLDDVIANYSIDQSRIYSTGMSNGGYMSFLLACQLSERFAAVASVTGSMTPQTFDQCNPNKIVPVLQIHGNADGVVPYNGAFWSKSINEVLEYWATHNACDSDSDLYNINDSNTSDGTTVEQFVYDNGNQCSSVVHFKVEGGGHDWPGAWGNMDINGTNEVWNFLSQYDLDGLIGCITSTDENVPLQEYYVFPNPSSNVIFINSHTLNVTPFQLIDTEGRVVKADFVDNKSKKINVENLSPGLYYLSIKQKVFKIIKI